VASMSSTVATSVVGAAGGDEVDTMLVANACCKVLLLLTVRH
jgi:hypothetical protein